LESKEDTDQPLFCLQVDHARALGFRAGTALLGWKQLKWANVIATSV
jgi:hypothetical protein